MLCGPITCPGKSIKIVCRLLQFHPDSGLKDAAIIVDGKPGEDGRLVVALPKDGPDGVGLRPGADIWGALDTGVDGVVGEAGEPGNTGTAGQDGGTIEICCGALARACVTTLSANGGKGGAGSSGIRGGHGGRGSNGAEILRGGLHGQGGVGAPGSPGGPGGAGSNGGRGGAINLALPKLASSSATSDQLLADQSLKPDEAISSANGHYTLKYQSDGRLVLYRNRDRKELWDTKKTYPGAAICIMQSDGNLVIYDTLPSPGTRQRYVWLSGTAGHPGSRLVVQDNGDVAICTPDDTRVWTTSTRQRDRLLPDESLRPDESIWSPNGQYALKYQSNGDLVLYRNRDAATLWHTNTDGKPGAACTMQSDGNLVIYDAAQKALWSSVTFNNPGSRLVVQDDGDAAIYRSNDTRIWGTNTRQRDRLLPDESLKPDESVSSLNGQYTFKYQSDGNLVLYRNRDRTALWDTKSAGKHGAVCTMQGDGNLVIYDQLASPRSALWSSGTYGNPGSRLAVGDDGDVVICQQDGKRIWATDTGPRVVVVDEMLTLSARGGDGGGAGKGGDGGRGGDGGTVEGWGKAYGRAGQGGPSGPGGKGGYGGKGGSIRIAWADPASAELKSGAIASHGRQGADGADGGDGANGTWDRTPLPSHGRPVPLPGHVPSKPRAQQRAVAASDKADSATRGALEVGRLGDGALRQQVSLGQLRMLVERLRFLFLRLGRADLTIDPEQQNPDLVELLAGIQWIQDLLGQHADGDKDHAGFASASDQSVAAALLQSANSLFDNLRFEKDYFGNTSTFAPLGTVAFFDGKKKQALKDLQKAEDDYRSYRTAMNGSAQRDAGLQLAVSVASRRRRDIETEAKDTLDDCKAALAKINQLRDLLAAKMKALADDAGDLKEQVRGKWGVSWQDLFGCLTQFSFQHWSNLPEKIESGPALMAAGQIGDLFQKGISNIVSDSGQSLSKDYVVKQVESLTSGMRSLRDLTLTRSKFIDQNNLYNDSYKLMMTRDQFKSLCSDFTNQLPAAQNIIDDLDEYVSLADRRNAAVLEYNQLWQRVYDLQAEAVKAEADYEHAQAGLAGKAQPSLPIFTSFATERYNRAKDLTLHIYYLASRAYILKSLKVRNLFSSMLSQLPATGQIDAATLTQGDLEDLYDQVIDELGKSGPDGPCKAHFVFRKSSHPEIFKALAANGVASFTVPKPTRKDARGPFSGLANVRLTKVRCWAGGLAPRKEHYFKLVHTGRETFVTSGGGEVVVNHDAVFLDYKYRPDTAIDPTAEEFDFKGYEELMPLTDGFALIGPFTTWTIVLDDADDRAKIESLRVEFDAMHQTSKPKTQ